MTGSVVPGSGSDGGPPDTAVRRLAEKAVDDPAVLDQILASALVAHVGVVIDGWPYVMPVACAPLRDGPPWGLLLHGSTGSRLFRAAAGGARMCATISLLDGLVLARSAYNSSMNYRSAMVMGVAEELDGEAKSAALETLTDHLLPGRREHLRPTTNKEFAATMVLALPATHWSVKVGVGGPDDPPEDVEEMSHLWAGSVPLTQVFGRPEADEFSGHLPIPGYIGRWGDGESKY